MGHTSETRKRAWEKIKSCRKTWLSQNGPCMYCGSYKQLEVDHVDPKTKISHSVWSWSEKRRGEELSKCQVLCSPCHRKKTIKDLGQKQHGLGSVTRYRHDGCRCSGCKEAKRSAMADYRRRTGNH